MTSTYYFRKMNGLCTECGRPSQGKVKCPECMRKGMIKRYNKQQERIAKGLCAWCGQPAEERLCPLCRETERRYAREYREKHELH